MTEAPREDLLVDLRYQEMELGCQLRIRDFSKRLDAFLECSQPMPVGASLVICAGSSLQVKVQVREVVEQVSGMEGVSGMLLRAVEVSLEARDWWLSQMEGVETATADTEFIEAATPEEVKATEAKGEAGEGMASGEETRPAESGKSTEASRKIRKSRKPKSKRRKRRSKSSM